jgi:L-threonylcarbamoyladenylate synthase
MEKALFEEDLEIALAILRKGGVILYPTDTVWGIGCDATNEKAVSRIYSIKQRDDSKSLILLVSEERDVLQYVAAPDPEVFDFIASAERPTTVIFDHALGLPDNLVASDGSIAIRIVREEFCRHLVKRLRKPLVSTSANISGSPTPAQFSQIDPHIKSLVDYVVRYRQEEEGTAQSSRIIKWEGKGKYQLIRP